MIFLSDSRKNNSKIISVFVATIIGAGFASGQEIVQFFLKYGQQGIYGLALSSILFGLVGWAILELGFVYKTEQYEEFIRLMMGKVLGKIMSWIVTAYMFIIYVVMLAGTGALFKQYFNVSFTIGVVIMALITLITFIYGLQGVIYINKIIGPILIIGSIFLGLYLMLFESSSVFFQGEKFYRLKNNWITSAFLYVSYNMLPAAVILSSMSSLIYSKSSAKVISWVGGGILGLIGVFLALPLFIHYSTIQQAEVPLLKLVSYYSSWIEPFYFIVFFFAILSTAGAAGYGFLQRLCLKSTALEKGFKVLFVLIGSALAHFGFSTLVLKGYTFFGYLGMFQMLMILFFFLIYKLTQRNGRRISLEQTPIRGRKPL